MATELGRRFNSPSLGASVVDGHRKLRQEARLCDVQLVVGRQKFAVHRTYLASRSDYFVKLFDANFKEKGQSQVEIKEVSAGTLSTVLDYLYSGDVVLNDANIEDVTEAAHYMQLYDLLSLCTIFMKEELTPSNCIPFLHASELYELGCRREITEFIVNNFEAVGRSDQFQYLPDELLVEVLSSDRLVASTEMEVLRIVSTWLEGNQSRQPDITRVLLGLIRYGLMTGDEMEDVMAMPAFKSKDCSDVLNAATQYHMRLFSQPILSTSLSRMRDCKDCLVVMGAGYSEDTLNGHVLAAPMLRGDIIGDWVCLNPTTRPRFASAAAVVNDFVFLAGGKIVRSIDESHASDKALRYNPRGGQWLQLSSMTVPRANFVLLALQSCLIAVGGRHREGPLDSVERYDIASNEWSLIPASLPGARFGHAGCSIGSRAFISGGFLSEDSSSDVLSFDLARSTWERLASMNHSRGYHAIVPHGNRLFVCGGTSLTGYQGRDVLSTESYDIQTDSWTELSRQRQCQSQAPAVSSGTAIFVLGGYGWGTSTTVSSYDIERDSWEVHGRNIPQSVTGGVAFHLRLPRKLLIAPATVNN